MSNETSISLEQVITEVKNLPTRTLFYGINGIGKTTTASGALNPIFIPTEDGATRIAVPKFPQCKTWKEVMDCLRVLYVEDHGYKTVVLDSADWGQSLAIDHVCGRDYAGDMAAFDSYGRGYKPLMVEWMKLLSAFDHLRCDKGMEVILIAHAVVRTFKNPLGDDYDRYESNLHSGQSTSLWAKTKEWADIVLFANYEVLVRKDNPNAAKGKGVMVTGEGSRVCHAAPSASWDAKVRAGWSLPAKFPLDQTVFRNHLNKEHSHEVQS